VSFSALIADDAMLGLLWLPGILCFSPALFNGRVAQKLLDDLGGLLQGLLILEKELPLPASILGADAGSPPATRLVPESLFDAQPILEAVEQMLLFD
jgi:hypothetical protein